MCTRKKIGESVVSCIKKSKSAERPLDYRPIALLNSDYKIFTRVFASRLRSLLSSLIHPLQTGFVPRREMSTIFDILAAAKICSDENLALETALLLRLDFSKSYDSLSRVFLFAALRKLGLPETFLDVVEALHIRTWIQFIVNG